MELVRKFEQLDKNDVELSGGKGASLGEMTAAGIPVPPGFVILSSSFEQFLKETDLNVEIDSILGTVNHNEIHTVEHASKEIQSLILAAEMPADIKTEIIKYFSELNVEYVAVRSSATAEDSSAAAWAGQLDSFLNTTENILLENVKKCWASLFTPRAIFYRFEKELHKQKISVAVVVQKMVDSEKSGIAFSVHPVTEDKNQLIIEAGFGLGEAIVSGSVTPDSYVVTKNPKEVLDINISNQTKALFRAEGGGNEWKDLGDEGLTQVLTTAQILELSELVLKIENHYGFPCDIEWAFEQGQFYITQSRPITTLLNSKNAGSENSFDRWIIQNKLDFLYKANYDLFTIDLYYQTSLINKSLIGSQDTDYVIFSEKGEAAAYYPVKQENTLKLFDDTILQEVIGRSESAKNKFQIFVQKYTGVNLETVNLVEFFDDYCSVYIDLVACFRTTRPVYVDALVEKLKAILIELGAKPEVLSYLLVSENDDDIRLEQADWIAILKDGDVSKDKFKQYIEKYPWLFPSEYDFDNAVKKLTTRYDSDAINSSDKVKEGEVFLKELNSSLAKKKEYLDTCTQAEVKHLTELISNLSDFRTFFKLTLGGIVLTFSELLKQISFKANLEPEIFYNAYTIEDIRELLQNHKLLEADRVKQRNEYYVYIVKNLKNEITSDLEYSNILKKHFSSGKKSYILGASASTGLVTGVARVLSNKEVKNLTEESLKGKILVTTMTDPSIMPFIRNCLAFVTDEGGLTSHAAIVSRELNIPCIVGTKNGTEVIKDGDTIEVDADNGIVKILK